MHRFPLRSVPVLASAAVLGLAVALAGVTGPVLAQTPPAKKKETKAPAKVADSAPTGRGEQAIVVLVNDEPITAWEIEQRAGFLIANGAGGSGGPELKAKAEARWAQIVKDPKTNERFQQLLREKNVRSKEEAQAVQQAYVKGLQQTMVEQLKREARASALPKLKSLAQEELIEERLKLQEAKKLGIEMSDEDTKKLVQGLADRNKMTVEQFAEHVKGIGFNLSTLRERMRAQVAWREAIRRRFGGQVSVNQRDVDRLLTASATETGEDTVELQVHKISLPMPGSVDQTAIIKRYTQAETLRSKFDGCKSTAELAKTLTDARFEDMKFVKPASIAEPTRSMMLRARDGDMLPPVAAATGIEVYAVCGRRAIKADDKLQQKAAEEIQTREFELYSKRHLLDIKQEAHIEYR